MYISYVIISIPLILILAVLIINKIKPLPYIKINLFLLVLASFLYLGRIFLPHVLQLPINTFNITYHNADFESIQSLDGSGSNSIKDHLGTSFYLEGFAGKKMFYDKEKDFYVLMDGIIFTPVTVQKTFNFHLTWAKADLIINSEIVKEIDRTQSYNHIFSPGFHHVTIKIYNTDVIPTKMFVSMTEYQPIISDQNITLALQPYLKKDMNLYYAFGYKEKKIKLLSSTTPTIAFLKSSAGGASFWELTNCKNANLKAIVYSGVGSTIQTDCEKILILQAEDLPKVTRLPKLSECNDYAPIGFSCPDGPEKLTRLNEKVKQYTGKYLTGLTLSQTDSNLILPQIKLDNKKYKELAEISEKIKEASMTATKQRENPFYKLEQKSWADILQVDNKQIPLNKFHAFYMQSQQPNKVIYSEDVSKVSILYSRNEKFHNIEPDHFMALWIGDFEFNKNTLKELTLSISWAKVKLLIDGKIVYNGGSSTTIPYTFTKGKHRIEIEYSNNYGQVDFLFDMQNAGQEVNENFKALIKSNTKIYMVGAYSGWRDDHALDIKLKESIDPVILFVASYEPIHWNIKNAKNLKAVVYNSYDPGSSIKTDNSNVKIFHDQKFNYVSRLMPYCYDGPFIHCENKNSFQNSVGHIVELTGKKPNGFSSIEEPSFSTKRLISLESTKDIIVPQIILDTEIYKKIDNKMKLLK